MTVSIPKWKQSSVDLIDHQIGALNDLIHSIDQVDGMFIGRREPMSILANAREVAAMEAENLRRESARILKA